MSTSCIIALVENDDIILLEKTHDGFFDVVKHIFDNITNSTKSDIEDLANCLIRTTDIEFSIYNHKYPCEMIIYYINNKKFKTIQIVPDVKKISRYLELYKDDILNDKSPQD